MVSIGWNGPVVLERIITEPKMELGQQWKTNLVTLKLEMFKVSEEGCRTLADALVGSSVKTLRLRTLRAHPTLHGAKPRRI